MIDFIIILAFAIGIGLVVGGLYFLEKSTGSISKLFRHYEIWLEKQNENFRKLCILRQKQALYEDATICFPIVAGLVYQALCDCAESIGAVIPPDMYRLADSPHITIGPKGFAVFHFRFRLRRGNGMSARDIQRHLQSELDRGCYHHGVPQLVVHVTLTPDGVVLLQVAWATDLLAVQKSAVVI